MSRDRAKNCDVFFLANLRLLEVALPLKQVQPTENRLAEKRIDEPPNEN